MATFVFTPAANNFSGPNSQYNFYYFTPTTLQSSDVLNGGATGLYADVGIITDTGTINSSQFAGVSGLEQLRLSGSGNNVTLTDALVAGSDPGFFTVVDGAANDWRILGTGDDDGDGKSDILWRKDDGAVALSVNHVPLNALSSANEALGTAWYPIDGTWHVIANADTSGDGKSDVIWRNDNGTVAVWQLDGTQVPAAAIVGSIGSEWAYVASVDFDGDAKNDVLFEKDGQLTVWELDGTSLKGAGIIGQTLTPDWHVVGAADVSGDHKADVVWRNDSGAVQVWVMDGLQTQTTGVVGQLGNEWLFAGFSDFNGDGRNDILWQRSDGTIAIWQLDGTHVQSAAVVGSIGTDWHVIATADFDGDGKSDILWRNDAGNVAVWTMDGLQVKGSAIVSAIDTSWHLVSTGDSNGDGRADLLWHDDDGSIAVWYMNGTGVSGLEFIPITGNDVIDASAVAAGHAIHAFIGSGNDTYTGGADSDTVSVLSKQINGGDIVNAGNGAGIDTLLLQDANGTLTAGQLQNFSGFEAVTLSSGGTVTLSDGNFGAASMQVIGSAAVDAVDASSVNSGHAVVFSGGGGADSFKGGAGDDTFRLPDSNFALIQGNGGLDRITLTQPGQSFDLTANAAKIGNVEIIDLTASAGASLSLFGTDIPTVSAASHTLYVVGGSDDDPTYGTGWTLVTAMHTNNAVAPGVNFVQYQHTNGSFLYVADQMPQPDVTESQAPLIDLNGNPAGNNFTANYTTGSAAGVAIGAADATLDDPDLSGVNSQIASLSAHITNPLSNDAVTREFLVLTSTGHSIVTSNGLTISGESTATLTISGASSDSVYQSVLREIHYVNLDERSGSNYSTRAVTVNAEDAGGGAAIARTSSISLTNGNHTPVAIADAATALEAGTAAGADATGNVLMNDTDADTAPPETKTVTTAGSVIGLHGTLQLNTDGSFTYVVNNLDPAVDALRDTTTTLSDAFNYTMKDSQGATATSTLTITIQGANDAPVAHDDTYATTEDANLSVAVNGVLANDTDVDGGDTKTVSAVNGSAANVGQPVAGSFGAFTLFADGHISYTPGAAAQALAAGAHATDTFTYTMKDTAGATSSATVTINLTGANDAPVANADNGSAAEDAIVVVNGNVLGNDKDAESDALTVSTVPGGTDNGTTITKAGLYGTLVITKATGAYTYSLNNADPAVQHLGSGATPLTDTFSYTANDGQVNSASANLVISIAGSNDGPVATGDVANVTEDGPLTATGNLITGGTPDSDFDIGDTLTVVNVSRGATNITPDADGETIAGVFGSLSVKADGAYTYTLNNAAVQSLGAAETRADTFAYRISDGHGGTATASLSVTVHGSNDPIVFSSPLTATVVEDLNTTADRNVLANLSDADTTDVHTVTTVAFGANPAVPVTAGGVSINGTYGTLTINAAGGSQYQLHNGDAAVQALNVASPALHDVFTITVTDGTTPVSTTLTVDINGTNDAPVNTAPAAATVGEDLTLAFTGVGNTVSVADVDNPSLSVTLSVSHGVLNVIGSGSATVGGSGSTTLTVSGTTADINATLASLSYNSDLNFHGGDTLTIVTTDGVASDTDTVAITVSAVNDSPVAVNDAVTTLEDNAVTYAVLINDTDVDGDTLTVSPTVTITEGAAAGTAVVNADNTITFTPTANYNGPAHINYAISDGNGGLATATLTVTVSPVNDAPVAHRDPATGSLTTPEDTPRTIDVLANDTDTEGQALTIASVNGQAIGLNGFVTVPGGVLVRVLDAGLGHEVLSFTPDSQFNGAVTFNYTVKDSSGAESAPAQVVLNVTSVNDLPNAVPDFYTTNEDTPLVLAVLANDNDVEDRKPGSVGQINGVAVTTVGQHIAVTGGEVVVNSDGTLTFTPDANFNGDAHFSYTARDSSNGQSAPPTADNVTITVEAVDDAPVDATDHLFVAEDDEDTATGVTPIGNVLTNASDIDGPPPAVEGFAISVAGVLTPVAAGGSVALAGGAILSVAPNGDVRLDQNGAYDLLRQDEPYDITFVYRLVGSTEQIPVVITVTGVNDAPVAVNDLAPNAVLEGTALTVDAAHGVLANDTDVEFDALSVSDVAGATLFGGTFTATGLHGTLTLNAATGAYAYAAGASFGTDTFTYTVSDGAATDTATLTIEVTEQGIRTLDGASLDTNGNLFVGTGLTGQHFNVSENHAAGLELGLRVHYRNGVDILSASQEPDGTAHYIVPAGEQVTDPAHGVPGPASSGVRAAWSFDFSVDTDTTASTGKTLDDYNFTITIADGDGHTQVYDLVHNGPADTPWQLRGAPDFTGFTDDERTPDNHPEISQNSVNFGFDFLRNAFGADALNAGKHYDIQISAFDATTGGLLASAHDAITLNSSPVANNDAGYTVNEDGVLTGASVLANDTDANSGQALSAVLATDATHGHVVLNTDGTFTYTPDADFNGTDSFTYRAYDSVGVPTGNAATVTINVAPQNDNPVAHDDSVTTPEDTAVTVAVLINDTDIDGDTLTVNPTVTVVEGAAAGTAVVNADNTITFTPTANYNGPATINYSVSDGHSGTSSAVLHVTVSPVNDAPVAHDDALAATQDQTGPLAVNLLTNDTDIDGPSASVTSFALVTGGTGSATAPGTITLANGATLSVDAAGHVTLNQNDAYDALNAGETAQVAFTYQMSDNGTPAGTDDATAVITVTGVNDQVDLDLNGATAGEDKTIAPVDNVTTSRLVFSVPDTEITDAENQVSQVSIAITAPQGGGVNASEALNISPTFVDFASSLFGFTVAVTGNGGQSLTIAAPAGHFFTAQALETLLENVTYSVNDNTFAFNASDRALTVTVTDYTTGAPSTLTSDAATLTLDMRADVTDTSDLNTFTGGNLSDIARGGAGDDSISGGAGDDALVGGTGDDRLTGGADNDTLIGNDATVTRNGATFTVTSGSITGVAPAAAEHDTAVYSGLNTDYTVTRNVGDGSYTVHDNVAGRDGTDTLYGVETIDFGTGPNLDLGAPIKVFDATGTILRATFNANQLDQAVQFANDDGGANIIELDAGAGPFTAATWPVSITDGVTIVGVNGPASITAEANSAIAISESAVDGSTEAVRLENLSITGSGAANTVGVSFNGTYGGATDGAIELVHTSVSNFGLVGLNVSGGGTGLSVTVDGNDPATGGVETTSFSNSGGANPADNGTGNILFFGFTGAAALSNITVTGTNATADNGIQFAGYDPVDRSVDRAIGTVTFTNVAVSGTFEKTLVYIQGYDKLDGLSFAGGLALGASGSSATWAALFIDGGPQGITYNPAGTAGDATIDSTVRTAGVTLLGGTYGSVFPYLGTPIIVAGTQTDDHLVGAGLAEVFVGNAGDDQIETGAGNDIVVYNAGDGHDTITDVGGIDTLALVNITGPAATPSTTPVTWTVSGTTGNTTLHVDTDAPATTDEVAATGVEALVVQLGDGGDTVRLDGDLSAATISSIVINGGPSGADGNDVIDARTLSSANAINANLGAGDDTFQAANVVANDTIAGGGNTAVGDTADYSAATQAVTINLANGTASGASVGNDSITGFENAVGGQGGDTFRGTTGNNAFTGNGGIDTVDYGATPITVGMIKTNGSGWTVTSTDGVDTLSTVEVVQGADPAGLATGKFLLVGNGGYADFATAYAAAADGDTILLAPGTYAGDFTIAKAISIVGANLDVDDTGTRGPESILTGHWIVNAAGPVDINGVEFRKLAAEPIALNVARLTLASAATVESSMFYNEQPGGNKPISDTAINVTAGSGAVTIEDNLFSGDFHGKYFTGGNSAVPSADSASWGGGTTASGDAGAIVWNGGATLNIGSNTIHYARTALNLTGDDGRLTIAGNHIDTSGTGVTAVGWSGPANVLVDTSFTNVDNELNLRSNAAGVDIDLGGNGNTSDNWFSVLGTTGSDTIVGTAGKDAVLAEQGDDVIHTGAGNDSIFFNTGSGNDTVDGGSESGGKDTLIVANTASANNTLDPGDAGDPATSNSGNPSATPVTFNMSVTAGDVVVPTDGTNSAHDILITAQTTAGATPLGSVTADEIEDVQFNLGSGGDTVTMSGDFSTTSLSPSTITVNGGNGNDTVNASALDSATNIVLNGGGGDDTFFVSGAGGNDKFDGGTGTNTINFSGVDHAITVNLGQSTPQDTTDGLDTISNVQNVVGTGFGDTITGTSGANQITGGGGVDTVNGYGAGYHVAIQGGQWVVTNGTVTDTLTGVERVQIDGTTYLLVDHSGADVGGFQSVQSAIDFASGNETILIRGGETYVESHTTASGPAGLYINTAGLTLQGVSGTTGSPITTASGAQTDGPIIISGHENNFGANHWIDAGGTGTTFQGVHLKAGPDTNFSKVVEIWADNVSVTNSFVDTNNQDGQYSGAVAIYLNEDGTHEFTSYHIEGNLLNEGVFIANGVGEPGNTADQVISGNQFFGTFDLTTGVDRYDTIAIGGQVPGIGWLNAPVGLPTITGNSVADNSVPFLLRAATADAADLPSKTYVESFLANFTSPAALAYAYVLNPDQTLKYFDQQIPSNAVYHQLLVMNSIDSLNEGLDTTVDNLFYHSSGQVLRDVDIDAGDIIVVQSGPAASNQTILVDNVTVQATADSADLNLTLGTHLVHNGVATTDAVTVTSVTLGDYAAGQGANVDVTGNGLANTIVGNSGDNILAGGGGDDIFVGGKGADHFFGGTGGATPVDAGIETVDYSKETGAAGVTVDLGAGTATDTFGTHDTLSGIENVVGTTHHDVLTGSGDTNTFTGNGGGDDIDGGAGLDVAVFSGNMDTYTVTWNGTTATVHLNANGADHSADDHVTNVGELHFADHSTWLVNDDGAELTTIQSAVDASHSGDAILVAAGTYLEQVLVDGKNLTIRGNDGALIQAPATIHASFTVPTSGTPNKFALIGVTNADVTIDNIDLDGQGLGNQANGGDFSGAYFLNASGKLLNSAVTHIRNSGTTNSLDGIQHGNAVVAFATDSLAHAIEFGNNTISDFQKTGILVNGNGIVANVHDNDITGAGNTLLIGQNGVQISRGATGSVNGNTISGIDYANAAANTAVGILVFQSPNVTANGNTINGAAGDGDAGVFFQDSDGGNAHGNVLNNLGYGVVDLGTFTTPVNHLTAGADDNTFNPTNANGINYGFYPDAGQATGYTFSGSSGHDELQGSAGADSLTGLGGDDTFFYTAGDGTDVLLDGGTGGETLVGDTLEIFGKGTAAANAFDDTIKVVVVGDEITRLSSDGSAQSAADNVAGFETVTLDALGNGTNGDTLDYTGTAQAVTVNLSGTQAATGFDSVAGIENVIGGSGNDSLTGGAGSNTLSGSGGNDQINGNGGIDALSGGTGDDTFTYDVSVGGRATVDGGEGGETAGDTQIVNGTASPETFNINPIASGTHAGYLGINVEPNAGNVVPATDANYEVATKDVEEIVINTNGGGDNVVISGDLGGTGVANSTITVHGDDGANVLDASGVTASPGADWSYNAANGHYYRVVASETDTFTWAQANAHTTASTYLATITSQAENDFVQALVEAAPIFDGAWLGATDSEAYGASEGNWEWFGGPEAGQLFWTGAADGSAVNGAYANWKAGEPNDFGASPSFPGEDFAWMDPDTNLFGDAAPGKWNDSQGTVTPFATNGSRAHGYILETFTAVGVHLDGGAGNDTIKGGHGSDVLIGGADNDTFYGSAGTDVIYGGTIGADSGHDTVIFASGAVTLGPNNGAGGEATVTNGSDTTTLHGIEVITVNGTTLDLADDVRLFDGNGHLVGTFDHVQDAVNAVTADGMTIALRAGVIFTEQVVVDHGAANGANLDSLTITSFGTGKATIAAPDHADQTLSAEAFTGRDIYGVVTATHVEGFTLSNVVVDGRGQGGSFPADIGGNSAGREPDFVGVAYLDASGTVSGVDVAHVRWPYDGGNVNGVQGGGLGIYVINNDANALKDFTLVGSTITDFQKNGVTIFHADVTIGGANVADHNTITGGGAQPIMAQNGLQISSSTGTVEGNTIGGIGYTGPSDVFAASVLLLDNDDLTIHDNTITTSSAKAYGLTSFGTVDGDTGIVITDNHVTGVGGGSIGIDYSDSVGGTITGNTIDNYGTALNVYAYDGGPDTLVPPVTIDANVLTNIGDNGLVLDPSPTEPAAFINHGTDLADILSGAAGNDELSGLGGSDILQGRGGNDVLDGGSGTGVDTVDYAGEAAVHAGTAQAVVVNLSSTSFDPDGAGAAVAVAAGHATDTYGATDTLTGIEVISAASGYGDTVALDGDPEDWTITFDTDHWTVTGNTPLTQGQSYTLKGVETVVFQCNGPAFAETVHLVDPGHAGSAYTSVQDAVNHASSGDMILLSSGTFAGAIDIGGGAGGSTAKDITILGAHHGQDPALWTAGTETIIDRIGASGGDLTLDGVEVIGTVMGAGFVSGFQREAIGFVGDATDDLTVRNSIVTIHGSHYGDADGNVPFGVEGAGIEDYALGFNIGYNTGNITLDNVDVTPFQGLVPVGAGDFTVGYGMWINSSSTRSISITDSSFDTDQQRSQSIVFDGQPGGPQVVISGNTFGEVGSEGRGAIRVEDFSSTFSGSVDYSGIDGNTFLDAPNASTLGVGEYGLVRNGSGQVVSIGSADYGNGAGPHYDSILTAFSGAAGQTLTGGTGADVIIGSAHDDTINGGGGNDFLVGNLGNDSFVFSGQFGNDTVADFANGDDTLKLEGYAPFAASLTAVQQDADVLITINDGTVDSHILVQNETAGFINAHITTSGSDILIH